jgi:hypothetical protein
MSNRRSPPLTSFFGPSAWQLLGDAGKLWTVGCPARIGNQSTAPPLQSTLASQFEQPVMSPGIGVEDLRGTAWAPAEVANQAHTLMLATLYGQDPADAIYRVEDGALGSTDSQASVNRISGSTPYLANAVHTAGGVSQHTAGSISQDTASTSLAQTPAPRTAGLLLGAPDRLANVASHPPSAFLVCARFLVSPETSPL